LHNNFAESFVTSGLSPLPVCVLDKKKLIPEFFQEIKDKPKMLLEIPETSLKENVFLL